jgi:hypothetical protein
MYIPITSQELLQSVSDHRIHTAATRTNPPGPHMGTADRALDYIPRPRLDETAIHHPFDYLRPAPTRAPAQMPTPVRAF